MIWVDVFSGTFFSGQMRRFHINGTKGRVVAEGKPLSSIRSLIVGPNAVVRIGGAGGEGPIEIRSRTVLPDTSEIAHGKQKLRLILEPAGN